MEQILDGFIILMSLISVIFGALLIFRPARVIAFQIKFYEFINWRIEPVSMQKELRNTRIMGGLLTAISLISIIYVFIKKF